jgi:predicted RNA binding protein YcfA (HicA-like mRNA interferase family)
MNQKQWIALLVRHGWTEERGGKHVVKMTKPSHRPITLPRHNGATYGPGLDAAIRRQAGL